MTAERWKRVEELYHEARTRPPGERAAFLADACRDDEALRREVESLLNEPVSGDGFLDSPARERRASSIATRPSMTGRTLGGYHLQALLGAGGMGEVYRARDTKLGREVAIKILPRAFASDPDRLARFEREARMLASLNHPNIGAIYGLEEADGVRFLVLELVDGETLADELGIASRRSSRPRLPLGEALAIARQIAEALEAAHEKGHRPPRPEARERQDHAGRRRSRCSTSGWRRRSSADASAADLPTRPRHDGGTRDGRDPRARPPT